MKISEQIMNQIIEVRRHWKVPTDNLRVLINRVHMQDLRCESTNNQIPFPILNNIETLVCPDVKVPTVVVIPYYDD